MGARKGAGWWRPAFKHKRLDASDPTSIRLLRVFPDLSVDGLIQCEIVHANTTAEYICLSYLWGDPHPQHDILIKERSGVDSVLRVRENLWSFLNIARSRFAYLSDLPYSSNSICSSDSDSGFESDAEGLVEHFIRFSLPRDLYIWGDHALWIDAACIDQTAPKISKRKRKRRKKRTNKARNEMRTRRKWGRRARKTRTTYIQKRATEAVKERNQQVQMMGKIYSGRNVVAWLGNDREIGDYMETFKYHKADIFSLDSPIGKTFMHNKYSTRAWITQEIELAESVHLLSERHELNFKALRVAQWNARENGFQGTCAWETPNNYFWKHLFPSDRNQSLMQALYTYRNKQCSTMDDRIYSLLALCNDGEGIQVSYGKSRAHLLVDTMRACPSSLCLCSVATLATALDLSQPLKQKDDKWLRGYGIQIQIFSIRPGNRGPRWQKDDSYSQRLGLRPDPVHPRECSTCGYQIPERFCEAKGRIFCFSKVCSNLSHFLWENTESVHEGPGEYLTGTFHLQPYLFSDYTFQCDKAFSMSRTNDQRGNQFILRSTFASLIRLSENKTLAARHKPCIRGSGPLDEGSLKSEEALPEEYRLAQLDFVKIVQN
ncbi:hypothetical protein EJ04DRAFT_560019 [Polyplosphaeria fusca]|uniref:Heterokaryon incompatibility domain-containing protein n=1 Tax=Polyplosphaeria fusca TaxID=682080 RepID=A0A9P4V460_9PLEO|nr:hypothetical protein EJ04DRAFT_560019 [Polyplosphaeria fusca]